MNVEFSALRRKAGEVERHLEEKCGNYQSLGRKLNNLYAKNGNHATGITSRLTVGGGGGSGNGGDTTSLVQDLKNLETNENSSRIQIEGLLNTMSSVVNQMDSLLLNNSAASSNNNNGMTSPGNTTNSSNMLLLRRYKEIHADYKRDFTNMKSNIISKKQQSELFTTSAGYKSKGSGMFDSSNEEGGGDGGDSLETNTLLRERSYLQGSTNAVSNVLNQANASMTELRRQRTSLVNSNTGVSNIASFAPKIGSLIGKIRSRKNWDNKVLAGTIGTCVFFTLWYMFF